MSTLKVEIVEIKNILPHPNADRLEIAQIKGWNCVVRKDEFRSGDKGIYFPIDSILPEAVESTIFPPESKVKLSGGRVRTIKLRKCISQGLLVHPSLFGYEEEPVGSDLTGVLGVTKFEPKAPITMRGNPRSRKESNPYFFKYTNIENFKNYPDLFQVGEPVVITEKIYGCLRYDQSVDCADGSSRQIGNIVKNKIDVEVLGMNSDGEIVPTKILNHFDNGSCKDWYKVTFKRTFNGINRGNWFGSVVCTDNHKFYDPKNNTYKKCVDLKSGDSILLCSRLFSLPYITEQTLIGKMIGDGSFSKNSITFGHKKQHEKYLYYTLDCLGDFAGNQQKDRTSGYGTEMVRGRSIQSYMIGELFKDWFDAEGKKVVPRNVVLSPISLAFWYMDDGSLSRSDKQEDRASFATNGFNEESLDNLVSALEKMGITAKKVSGRINLYQKEAKKLFILIAPYVPKIMQYKLPERFRGFDPIVQQKEIVHYETVMKKTEIIAVKKIDNNESYRKYDIETETHNFFVNGILVHNSNFRCGWVPTVYNTRWKKFKSWLGKLFNNPDLFIDSWEFVFGSRNVQLQDKPKEPTFYSENLYAKIVKQYHLKDLLPKGYTLYGEIYGDGIQKGYTYGCEPGEHKLICFDIKTGTSEMGHENYVDFCEMKGFCEDHGLDVVPTIYEGPFDPELLKDISDGPSVLCPDQKVREGVVIKPIKEEIGHYGRKVLKYINDEYLLKKDNTDFH